MCKDLPWIKAFVTFFMAALWMVAKRDLEIPIWLAAEMIPRPLICLSLRASSSSCQRWTLVVSLMPSVGSRIVRVGTKLICLGFFFLHLGAGHSNCENGICCQDMSTSLLVYKMEYSIIYTSGIFHKMRYLLSTIFELTCKIILYHIVHQMKI